VTLIKEINDLRKELKIARSSVHDLEAALGLHRKSNKDRAVEVVAELTTTNRNAALQRDLEEKVKVVTLQKDEIVRLRNQIREMELMIPDRNGSITPKLIPI